MTLRRPPVLAALLLSASVSLAGCGGSHASDGSAASPSASASSTGPVSSAPGPSVTPSATVSATRSPSATRISKLLLVVVENHSLDAMRQEMPYTFGLARRYGYATDYRAISHPSLPNYLVISGGDTFGISDDRSPAAHAIQGPSVFGEALARHLSAKVYAEDMTGTCAPYDRDRYAVRHNPWTYYTDERAACQRYDVPIAALPADVRAGRLPDAGMVVPDLCDDAHDCPASSADAWMRSVIGPVLDGPDFASGRLLVAVTADEDHRDEDNLVLTALLSPQLHGVVVTTPLSHYSLSRLYSEVLGAAPLRRAVAAPSMATAFGLRVGQADGRS